MYQNIQNQIPPGYYTGGYTPQQNPNTQYDMNYAPRFTSNVQPASIYLKGRPVVSLEEARAAQIDLDGSIHIFTDIGNKKIYTKQINLDGTATLNIYNLQEEDNPAEEQVEFVTKAEFNEEMNKMQSLLNLLIPKETEKNISLNNF